MKLQLPFYQKPIASFNVTKDTLCEGQFTTFFDTLSTAPGSNLFSWTWDYGDGTTPNTTTVPTATYAYSTASSLYTATLVVRNTQLCESEPATKTIVVYRTPKIDSIPVIYAIDGTMVQFNPKVKDSVGISFAWTAPAPYGTTGLSNDNVLRPYLMVTQYPPFGVSNPAQVYTLYAEEPQYHCIDSANQIVRILGKIIVPNAFSPNGDGINDTWKITSLADYPGATLDIYDRYGAKAVHLTGSNMVWDGTINGTPAPVATYYYVIDPGNKMPLVTGWVVLLK
ncbi:MAG: gliding motility-associated C-terminal domain-containing protein [Bacteroidetes bacterium]|nr:gliding motility-associated C-terminal domain-containing protein [Bacteroidota bacterium]